MQQGSIDRRLRRQYRVFRLLGGLMTGPSMKNSTETARQRIEWCRAPIRMSYISYESSPPSGLEWGPKQLRRVGANIDVGTCRRGRRSELRFSVRLGHPATPLSRRYGAQYLDPRVSATSPSRWTTTPLFYSQSTDLPVLRGRRCVRGAPERPQTGEL